jgi:hypothetical protein
MTKVFYVGGERDKQNLGQPQAMQVSTNFYKLGLNFCSRKSASTGRKKYVLISMYSISQYIE